MGLLVAVCAGGLIADVSAQTPAHSIDSVSPRSVGPISAQVVVTVSNVPGTTPAYHFRYRADGDTGAWTSGGTQSTSDTTFTRTITSTSFTDGSAWDFEVDVVSTFDDIRTAGTHTHAATTLYVLNTLDDVLWEIDDISDVSGNDTNLGAVTGNAANAFGMVEFAGWMWAVLDSRELLRTRTPGTLDSWTSLGTLPEMEGSVRDIYADDTHIYILLQEAAYRIGNLTSSFLTASKMQATFSGHFRRGGAWVDDHYYTVSSGGGETRICGGANAVDVLGNCSNNAVTGLSHPRAATEFNGRLLVWEQDDHQLYEILSPTASDPTALSLGTGDSSLADDVNAIASWSGNPATIVSGVATTGSITQTATIRVTLTAADSDGQTIYLLHRANGGSTWTETNASATGLTHIFSLSGLTFSTTYQVQASMDYNFPPDDRASTTFTTPATAPDAPTGLSSTPGNGQVVLSWTPPAANGSDIIRYGYSSDDGSTWRTTGSATNSYTATQTSASSPVTLQNGTQYAFRIRAVNSEGTGPASNNASATPNTVPAFSSNTVTREVYENVGAGANVGDPVTATDADHDTITYTLGGTDAASFAIDSTSGQITVGTGTTLDYQVKRSYEVTVTATDSLNAADSTTVTINVLDIREAGFLGRIGITVGRAGGDYGYVSGSYGTLGIGEFPVALFGDDTARTVGGIYEDADGNWYFTYSGGMADDWNISQKELDEVVVEVTYEDGKDSRSFVLGGFIEERTGDYTLKFDPPLPSRDWDDKDGEEVAFEFRRLRSQTTATTVPRETEPEGERGSFVEFLTESTPGGAVTAQMLIVILVYLMFIRTAPPTPFGVMLSAGVLILSPWVPMIFGYGDVLAASIILVNVLLAAFTYKVFAARTQ